MYKVKTEKTLDLNSVGMSSKDPKYAEVVLKVLCNLCRNGKVYYPMGWENSKGEKLTNDELKEVATELCSKVKRFINLINCECTAEEVTCDFSANYGTGTITIIGRNK